MTEAKNQRRKSRHFSGVSDPTWTAYGAVCAAEGTDRSKDLRAFIRWRIGTPNARMPRRGKHGR